MLRKNILILLLIIFIGAVQLALFAALTYFTPKGLLDIFGLPGWFAMPLLFMALSVYVLKRAFPDPSK